MTAAAAQVVPLEPFGSDCGAGRSRHACRVRLTWIPRQGDARHDDGDRVCLRARDDVRDDRGTSGAAPDHMKLAIAAFLVALAFPGDAAPQSRRPTYDVSALAACNVVLESVLRFIYGADENTSVEVDFQRAFDQASRSDDQQLYDLLGAAVAGIRDRSPDGSRHVTDLVNHCGRAAGDAITIWKPTFDELVDSLFDRPTRSISLTEHDQRVKRVLERAGARNARCTNKQYGPGWATVCE